jgi:acyl-CoA reductase-like NAD-dependent aldehyde dehydrogenase
MKGDSFFLAPTIFDSLTPSMTIAKGEMGTVAYFVR